MSKTDAVSAPETAGFYGVANLGMVGRGYGCDGAAAALAAAEASKTLADAPSTSLYFEYLDHTADVQIHAWGENLERALEHSVLALFGYMTDLSTVHDDGSAEPRRKSRKRREEMYLGIA